MTTQTYVLDRLPIYSISKPAYSKYLSEYLII